MGELTIKSFTVDSDEMQKLYDAGYIGENPDLNELYDALHCLIGNLSSKIEVMSFYGYDSNYSILCVYNTGKTSAYALREEMQDYISENEPDEIEEVGEHFKKIGKIISYEVRTDNNDPVDRLGLDNI